MAMTAQLYSVSALAVELGRDRRTIAKALRHIQPDGLTPADERGWYLATALRALDASSGRRNAEGSVDDRLLETLEEAAERTQNLLDRLRAEADVARRREIVKGGAGAVVGELAHAFQHIAAAQSVDAQMVQAPFVNRMLGHVIAEVLDLCQLKLSDLQN